MITRALRAYRQGESLDTSEVLALTRVEQELMGAGPGARDEAPPPGALHGPTAVASEVGEGPPYRHLEPQARPAAHPAPAHVEPGISHTLRSRLSGEPNAMSTGVPAGAILGGYSANPTLVSPQVQRGACPSLDAYVTGPTPTVRFAGIPAYDTRHSGAGPPDDNRQVQILADIAYGISRQIERRKKGATKPGAPPPP